MMSDSSETPTPAAATTSDSDKTWVIATYHPATDLEDIDQAENPIIELTKGELKALDTRGIDITNDHPDQTLSMFEPERKVGRIVQCFACDDGSKYAVGYIHNKDQQQLLAGIKDGTYADTSLGHMTLQSPDGNARNRRILADHLALLPTGDAGRPGCQILAYADQGDVQREDGSGDGDDDEKTAHNLINAFTRLVFASKKGLSSLPTVRPIDIVSRSPPSAHQTQKINSPSIRTAPERPISQPTLATSPSSSSSSSRRPSDIPTLSQLISKYSPPPSTPPSSSASPMATHASASGSTGAAATTSSSPPATTTQRGSPNVPPVHITREEVAKIADQKRQQQQQQQQQRGSLRTPVKSSTSGSGIRSVASSSGAAATDASATDAAAPSSSGAEGAKATIPSGTKRTREGNAIAPRIDRLRSLEADLTGLNRAHLVGMLNDAIEQLDRSEQSQKEMKAELEKRQQAERERESELTRQAQDDLSSHFSDFQQFVEAQRQARRDELAAQGQQVPEDLKKAAHDQLPAPLRAPIEEVPEDIQNIDFRNTEQLHQYLFLDKLPEEFRRKAMENMATSLRAVQVHASRRQLEATRDAYDRGLTPTLSGSSSSSSTSTPTTTSAAPPNFNQLHSRYQSAVAASTTPTPTASMTTTHRGSPSFAPSTTLRSAGAMSSYPTSSSTSSSGSGRSFLDSVLDQQLKANPRTIGSGASSLALERTIGSMQRTTSSVPFDRSRDWHPNSANNRRRLGLAPMPSASSASSSSSSPAAVARRY